MKKCPSKYKFLCFFLKLEYWVWAVQHIADDAEVSKYETDEKYLQHTYRDKI